MDSTQIGSKFRHLLSGKATKKPLVWLWGATPSFAVNHAGYPVAAAYNDPQKSFDAQIKTIVQFEEDGIPRMAVGGASDVTWAFGGALKWPADEYSMAPTATHHPANSEAEAESLSLPDDVAEAGPMPLYLDFARRCHKNGLPVFPFITSPIEGARSLCGPELLMRWMIRKPDLVHRLLQLATAYSVAVVRLFAAIFPPEDILTYLAAPTASNQMLSPRFFETFVLPYQKELHQKILQTGIRHIYCHICGEQNQNLPWWREIPMGSPGIVSFGHEVTIETAIKFFGQNCIIAGNIEPAVIHMGQPDEIYRLCMTALAQGSRAPRGYILMPGCGIPPNVPAQNLLVLKKAAAEFSQKG
ncbi:MAG: uroporphyrinogen decarboxylase family protein [Desulfobacterales bacterium]|jgi:uroporphyrinogen decarboxylase